MSTAAPAPGEMTAGREAAPPSIDPPLGHRHLHLPLCASTNDEAARLGRAGAPHGTIVTADAQTAGRGRLGRSWHSPPGANLYLSILLRPPLPPHRAPLLTLASGAALAQAVEAWLAAAGAAARVELKWPNDLLLGTDGLAGRKAAGILTELVCRGGAIDFLVVGIGVNLNGLDFPAELRERATSLRQAAGGVEVDGAVLRDDLLRRLDDLYRRFVRQGPAPVLSAYRAYAAFLSRPQALTVHSGEVTVRGVPAGLAEDGALLLCDETGATRRVVAGELS